MAEVANKIAPASRLSGVSEYYFSRKLSELDNLRKAGHDVINLGIGNPDIDPHPDVIRALKDALQDPGFHRYQSYKGIPALRQAFADWYRTYFHISLDPDSEILPLIGSKEGIMHLTMAFLGSGDEVLVPNPGYPTYGAAAKLAEATPIPYNLSDQNGWLPSLDELDNLISSKTKLMWINYPHMPTGAQSNREFFKVLATFAEKKGIILANDNPYGLILTQEQRSLLAEDFRSLPLVELNSLSKSHNMPGWRVGVACGNGGLIREMLRFKSNMDSGMFYPVMKAAVVALKLEANWYDSLNSAYGERRIKAFQVLELLECNFRKDQAGMFVWARIPAGWGSSEEYSDHILDLTKIFIPPGTVFGPAGEGFIRISLCSPMEVFGQVIIRLETTVDT